VSPCRFSQVAAPPLGPILLSFGFFSLMYFQSFVSAASTALPMNAVFYHLILGFFFFLSFFLFFLSFPFFFEALFARVASCHTPGGTFSFYFQFLDNRLRTSPRFLFPPSFFLGFTGVVLVTIKFPAVSFWFQAVHVRWEVLFFFVFFSFPPRRLSWKAGPVPFRSQYGPGIDRGFFFYGCWDISPLFAQPMPQMEGV